MTFSCIRNNFSLFLCLPKSIISVQMKNWETMDYYQVRWKKVRENEMYPINLNGIMYEVKIACKLYQPNRNFVSFLFSFIPSTNKQTNVSCEWNVLYFVLLYKQQSVFGNKKSVSLNWATCLVKVKRIPSSEMNSLFSSFSLCHLLLLLLSFIIFTVFCYYFS